MQMARPHTLQARKQHRIAHVWCAGRHAVCGKSSCAFLQAKAALGSQLRTLIESSIEHVTTSMTHGHSAYANQPTDNHGECRVNGKGSCGHPSLNSKLSSKPRSKMLARMANRPPHAQALAVSMFASPSLPACSTGWARTGVERAGYVKASEGGAGATARLFSDQLTCSSRLRPPHSRTAARPHTQHTRRSGPAMSGRACRASQAPAVRG